MLPGTTDCVFVLPCRLQYIVNHTGLMRYRPSLGPAVSGSAAYHVMPFQVGAPTRLPASQPGSAAQSNMHAAMDGCAAALR